MTLSADKMNGCGFINTAHSELLSKKTKVTVTWYYVATKGLSIKWSASVKKVSEQMRNDTFKRRLPFSFIAA